MHPVRGERIWGIEIPARNARGLKLKECRVATPEFAIIVIAVAIVFDFANGWRDSASSWLPAMPVSALTGAEILLCAEAPHSPGLW